MAKRKIGVYDRYEYPEGKQPTHLEPGVYVLTKDIENPNYDKRSEDWNKRPTIPAGMVFFVTDNAVWTGGDEVTVAWGSRINRPEHRETMRPDAYAYEPLVTALTKVDCLTTEMYLTWVRHANGYSGDAVDILARLLNEGTVTRAQVEAAVAANEAQAQAEHDAMLAREKAEEDARDEAQEQAQARASEA